MHNDAITDDALRAWVQDAGGNEVQRVLLAGGVVDGVPRVGTALSVGWPQDTPVRKSDAPRARETAVARARRKHAGSDSGCWRAWQRATMS